MDTVQTPNGTILPLTNLKGKMYLMVGYRLQWFNEVEKHFTINTEFLHIDDDQTICKATVTVFNENNVIVKQATATKRETKKDFSDHTEKAETSSIGRALAMLGYGTQFALSDLDEGERLADSPLVQTKKESPKVEPKPEPEKKLADKIKEPLESPPDVDMPKKEEPKAPAAPAKKTNSFRKPAPKVESNDGDWQ